MESNFALSAYRDRPKQSPLPERRQRLDQPGWSIRAVGMVVLAMVAVAGLWWWRPWQGGNQVEASQPPFEPLVVEQAWQQIAIAYEQMQIGAELWDVTTGTRASIKALDYFEAASISKMITASFVLSEVDAGRWSLDKRLADGVTTQWHLEQMIRQSNNDSWRKIRDALGRDQEQAYARQHGWFSFDLKTNSLSTADVANLYMQLARGELLSAENTDILLSYMTDTYEERFIPRSIPGGAVAYHKTGTLDALIHDAAIIEYQGRRYVLVIMSESFGASSYDIRMNLYDELVKAAFATLKK